VSLDKVDFARQIQARQFGLEPSLFSITIDPSTGGQGGGEMSLGVSYPVNLLPCDALWLPTNYDPSMGYNPCQVSPTNPNPNPILPTEGNGTFGINAYDLWDSNPANQVPITYAAIFSLQFNSPNAPWLIWSLSDSAVPDGTLLPPSALPAPLGGLVGQGDFMRSISGPISSMNVKFLQWAGAYDESSQEAVDSIPASRIVMLASLGFSQVTGGGKAVNFSSAAIGGQVPAAQNGPTPFSLGSGGYIQTNVNTLEHLILEERGLGNRGTLGGHNR